MEEPVHGLGVLVGHSWGGGALHSQLGSGLERMLGSGRAKGFYWVRGPAAGSRHCLVCPPKGAKRGSATPYEGDQGAQGRAQATDSKHGLRARAPPPRLVQGWGGVGGARLALSGIPEPAGADRGLPPAHTPTLDLLGTCAGAGRTAALAPCAPGWLVVHGAGVRWGQIQASKPVLGGPQGTPSADPSRGPALEAPGAGHCAYLWVQAAG